MPVKPDTPDGCNSNKRLMELFAGSARNLLVGKAKDLTLGDCWRLAGWLAPGMVRREDDPVLSRLTREEMDSVAEALKVHIRNKGNDDGWEYVGYSGYSSCAACGPCCGSAVFLKPHNLQKSET